MDQGMTTSTGADTIGQAQHSLAPEGVNFADLLGKSKITPADLARRLGVSVHVIYGWNKRGVSARSAITVSKILRCKPQEISRIGSASDPSLDFGQMRGRGRTAPVIAWAQCRKRIASMLDSEEYAVFLLEDDIDAEFCYALKCPRTPDISVAKGSGKSPALIVDPRVGGYADIKSKWGFIVDINQDLPVYRQIEHVGEDRYLVSADDHYPVQSMPFCEGDHKILGVVIAFGLAMA